MSDSTPEPLIDPEDAALDHEDDVNLDPGAMPEDAGVPEVADDEATGGGDVPEPQRSPMPTDAPIAATSSDGAARDEAEETPLDERLAAEEPDLGSGEREPADDGNTMHVEEDSPLLDEQSPGR